MSVKVKAYRRGWIVDIRYVDKHGKRDRERKRLTVALKTTARAWGESRERELVLQEPNQLPKKEVPTLAQFAPRFMHQHARANQLKPGGINHKQTVLDVHLIPALGSKALDAIGTDSVQQLKAALVPRKASTVNNVLTVLNTLLKKAVEWNVIDAMPCTVRLLKKSEGSFDFYDFAEFDAMLEAAASISPLAELIVLLGGEAGLRSGEIRALGKHDVNFVNDHLRVERNDWRGQVSSTKGNRIRYLPLSDRLKEVLKRNTHRTGSLVLSRTDGAPMSEQAVVRLLQKVAKKAGLRCSGPHILRHTFCSHLAMLGVPARTIQTLAGHKDLATTQRYMHLSSAAISDGIGMLNRRTRQDTGNAPSALP